MTGSKVRDAKAMLAHHTSHLSRPRAHARGTIHLSSSRPRRALSPGLTCHQLASLCLALQSAGTEQLDDEGRAERGGGGAGGHSPVAAWQAPADHLLARHLRKRGGTLTWSDE